MKGKAALPMLSSILSALLLLVACGTSPTGSPTQTPRTTTKPPSPISTVSPLTTTAASLTPRYGGTINIPLSANVKDFDEVYGWHAPAVTLKQTNESLIEGDWAKGPTGTNEFDFTNAGVGKLGNKTGCLAESWEIPQIGTIIFHIRKGMHYGLNPNSEASRLVNGRELNAGDIVFSLKQVLTEPRAYVRGAFPELARTADITAPDKSTVVVKSPPEVFADVLLPLPDFITADIPQEVVKKYGSMQDWRVSVGTGPFFLTDFVDNSSATLIRNPNYWGKDPVGPGKGNQLPYLDGIKYLIVPDLSTREAAIRTGKIDQIGALDWETAGALKKTTAELLYTKVPSTAAVPTSIRTDKAPFNDKRVRRAMMMATDFESIKKDLFAGEAQILTWPISYVKEYKNAYLGLDDPEMPASIKELYAYSPDKAKALLAEAGYPNGFKTSVICRTLDVDYYSVLKGMWAKVGIELTIDQKETGVWTNIFRARAYDGLLYGSCAGISNLYDCMNYYGVAHTNGSYVDDPHVAEVRPTLKLAAVTDETRADRIHKDLMKYVLDQAWAIPRVYPPTYNFWWPWVKNYHGETSVGLWDDGKWPEWVWLDLDLKQKMIGVE